MTGRPGLPLSAYTGLLSALRRPVGVVTPRSMNWGDQWIHSALLSLLDQAGYERRVLEPDGGPQRRWKKCGSVLLVGGGLGPGPGQVYEAAREQREVLLDRTPRRPLFLAPFSAPDVTDPLDRFEGMFARDQVTADAYACELCPCPTLRAPLKSTDPWWEGTACWLREDVERSPWQVLVNDYVVRYEADRTTTDEARERVLLNLGDPVRFATSPYHYRNNAATAAHCVTDRLHFAVAAWMQGREVTLLEGPYHKNRAFAEQWLEGVTVLGGGG